VYISQKFLFFKKFFEKSVDKVKGWW